MGAWGPLWGCASVCEYFVGGKPRFPWCRVGLACVCGLHGLIFVPCRVCNVGRVSMGYVSDFRLVWCVFVCDGQCEYTQAVLFVLCVAYMHSLYVVSLLLCGCVWCCVWWRVLCGLCAE